jgi:hypothetical protein
MQVRRTIELAAIIGIITGEAAGRGALDYFFGRGTC